MGDVINIYIFFMKSGGEEGQVGACIVQCGAGKCETGRKRTVDGARYRVM